MKAVDESTGIIEHPAAAHMDPVFVPPPLVVRMRSPMTFRSDGFCVGASLVQIAVGCSGLAHRAGGDLAIGRARAVNLMTRLPFSLTTRELNAYFS